MKINFLLFFKITLLNCIVFLLIGLTFISILAKPVEASRYGDESYGESIYSGTTGSSSGSNNSNNNNGSCTTTVGAQAPWLYGAIPQSSTSILLYFTEASQPVDRYAITYGLASNDYKYGADNISVERTSRMTYLVKDLRPNTTYYFKVRGGNGCAAGSWSNEISTRTMPSFVLRNLNQDNTKLETTPTESSGPEETTDIDSSEPSPTPEEEPTVAEQGYTVKIKVVDEKNTPVEGAKVTIHSKVQEATSDAEGNVVFNNVEKGDHRLLIAYKNYEGEQALNLTGDVREFSLEVKITPQNILLSPIYMWSVGILAVIAIILLFLLFRKRK